MLPKLSGPMLAPRSGGVPRQLVVLLHGYGSDGQDLIGLAPHWQGVLPDAAFMAPNAHEGVPGYSSGYQWFAPAMSGDRVAGRQAGCAQAAPVLLGFLADLWAQSGLSVRDTILVGFSQGAMMALHVGLSLPERLMGVIAFSGSFSPPADFGEPGLAKPPVCIVHGDLDSVVEPMFGEQANAILAAAGYEVHYHVSPGVGHGISPDGLAFSTSFIATVAARP